jgi:hypothetical protein
MVVKGYEFAQVCDLAPVRDIANVVQSVMPQSRYNNARNLPLNKYGNGPFCGFKIPNRFQASGVYLLTVRSEIRYVGECANLSARFNTGYGNISPKNCFKGGQETNCRLNSLVYLETIAGERISLWFFETSSYKAIEAELRSALRPAWNRV